MAEKEETNVSYLSAMYYTAAVLLLLAAVFSAINGGWKMAGVWFILGSVLFSYRLRSSRKQE